MYFIRVKFRSVPEKDAPMDDFEVVDNSQEAQKLSFEKSATVTQRLNIQSSILHPLILVPCSCRGGGEGSKSVDLIETLIWKTSNTCKMKAKIVSVLSLYFMLLICILQLLISLQFLFPSMRYFFFNPV